MQKIAALCLVTAFSFPVFSQLVTFEWSPLKGNDDADERGGIVSLTDYTLDAGSAFGERSYFAVHFRSVPMDPAILVQDARIRFVVQADTIEEVILKIELESEIEPREYLDHDYDISVRKTLDSVLYWRVRNVGKGDTIYTPNLAALIETLAQEQQEKAYGNLSFIFGPEWAVDPDGSTELEVYSTNQLDQERSPHLFMSFDLIYGIREQATGGLHLYPNPATEALNIEWQGQPITSIEVLDLSGKVLMERAGPPAPGALQLRTGALAAGTYLVRITTEESTTTERIIIR